MSNKALKLYEAPPSTA